MTAFACSGAQAANEYKPGELIVRFRSDPQLDSTSSQSSVPGVQALVRRTHVKKFRSVYRKLHRAASFHSQQAADLHLSNTFVMELDAATDVAALARELRNDPNVIFAEPNYFVHPAMIPNDPHYLDGTQSGLKSIHPEPVWTRQIGSANIPIAVIDTGVDTHSTNGSADALGHPDYGSPSQRFWTNTAEIPGNGIDDDGNGYIDDVHGWDFYNSDNDPMDDFGHGTLVAGILGATGNNGRGIAGVAWKCPIMPIKVLSASGSGTLDGVLGGIYYAVNNGARVINMSLIVSEGTVPDSLLQAAAYAEAHNVVFVAGAGNSNSNTKVYPAAIDTVIAVAAVNDSGVKADFSSYGDWVDVSAPGVNIMTTTIGYDSYGTGSGTSFSTPFVSGLAALILSENPALTAAQVRKFIHDGATPIDSLNPSYAGLLGSGRIDIAHTFELIDAATPHQLTVRFAYANVNPIISQNSYVPNSPITITAPDVAGYNFSQWSGSSLITSPTSKTISFLMPAQDLTVQALYTSARLNVTTPKPADFVIPGRLSDYDGQCNPGTKLEIKIGLTLNSVSPIGQAVCGSDSVWRLSLIDTSFRGDGYVVLVATGDYFGTAQLQTPVHFYGRKLIVNSGSGSGEYIPNETVVIAANAPSKGMMFDRWTGAPVENSTAPSTRLSMPDADLTLSATYKPAPPNTFNLTITSGTGAGTYSPGTIVSISADAPTPGFVFDHWTGATVTDAFSSSTTLTMPASDVSLAATYKLAPVSTPSPTPAPIAPTLPADNGFDRFVNKMSPTSAQPMPIAVRLKQSSHLQLRIYDVDGRLVKTLVDATRDAGPQIINWDGTNDDGTRVAANVYILLLTIDGKTQTTKVVVLR